MSDQPDEPTEDPNDSAPESEAEESVDSEFPEDWDFEGEDASKILKGLEAMIPGILKRSIMAGLGSLSDDPLKSVSEKNIPKEAVGFVLNSADATRREILRIVSREIRVFLENMDFGGEIAKILTTLSFEVRTEIRFVPNNEAVKPSIRNRVKIKRQRADGEVETVSETDEQLSPEDLGFPDEAEAPGPVKESKGRKRWSRKGARTEDSPGSK